MGVTVPVMKPSALPASMKIPPIRQTIYTSPTATSDDDHHTELVPITNRVPAMHTQPVQSMYVSCNSQIRHVLLEYLLTRVGTHDMDSCA